MTKRSYGAPSNAACAEPRRRVSMTGNLLRGWTAGSVVVLGLLLVAHSPARAGVTCQASLDRTSGAVGDQLVLSLEIEGDVRQIEEPRLPSIAGFESYGGGQSQRFSFINGQVHASHSYTWYLRSLQEGEFEIPSIEVVADGQSYRTQKIPVTISAAGAGSGASPPSSGAPQGAPAPQEATRGGQAGDDFFVSMSVDRDTVVVGEQIVLTFSFYRGVRGSVFDSPQYSPPTTEGFWREDLPPEKHSTISVQGQPYNVTQISYALFPTRTGSLEVGEAVVRIPQDRFGSLFRRRQPRGDLVLRAPAIPITVQALPPGAPANFTGTVASGLTLKVQTDRESLPAGEALTLSMRLEGAGYLAAARKPQLPELPAFREHDSGSTLDSRPVGGQLWGSLRVEKLLIAREEGVHEFPSIAYSYFDTQKGRYVQLSARPFTIEVTPAEQAQISSFATGGKTEIEILGKDILHIQPTTAGMRPYRGARLGQASTWILAALPPVLWIASSVLATRRRRLLADPGRLRAARALKDARAKLNQEGIASQRAAEALDLWIGARSGRSAVGLRREDATRWLASREISQELIREFDAFLDRCDAARYASAAEGDDFRDTAEQLLQRLEKELGRA